MVLKKIGQKEEEFFFKLPPVDGKLNFENSSGLVHEAEEVRKCILNGKLDFPCHTQYLSNGCDKVDKSVCLALY